MAPVKKNNKNNNKEVTSRSFLIDSGANMSIVSAPSTTRTLANPVIIQGFNGSKSSAHQMGTVNGSVKAVAAADRERRRKMIQSNIAGIYLPQSKDIISVSQLTRGNNTEVCFKGDSGSISLTDMKLSIPLRMDRGLYYMDMNVSIN